MEEENISNISIPKRTYIGYIVIDICCYWGLRRPTHLVHKGSLTKSATEKSVNFSSEDKNKKVFLQNSLIFKIKSASSPYVRRER